MYCDYLFPRLWRHKFNSNIEKKKHEPDKLDDEIKLLETREDRKWKKEATLIMGGSILSGLREHKMSRPVEDP